MIVYPSELMFKHCVFLPGNNAGCCWAKLSWDQRFIDSHGTEFSQQWLAKHHSCWELLAAIRHEKTANFLWRSREVCEFINTVHLNHSQHDHFIREATILGKCKNATFNHFGIMRISIWCIADLRNSLPLTDTCLNHSPQLLQWDSMAHA